MSRWRYVFVAALGAVTFATAAAQTSEPPHLTPRNLLGAAYGLELVESVLVDPGAWHPLPTINDREVWRRLPESARTAHIAAAESLSTLPWEAMPATLFLEFVRTGNRSNYQDVSFGRRERLALSVIAELIENQGRFLDDIVDGIWMISEETFWGIPAHMDLQSAGYGLPDVNEPVVDLFAAETGALLAWTLYLLEDRLETISPLVPDRIRTEVSRRILQPLRDRDDFWWMGFDPSVINNWSPWIVSNWLPALLIVETDPAERAYGVHKAMRVLDIFLNSYPDDGGCDEGPGYWNRAGGSLLDALEILHSVSDGRISIYDEPLVRDMARFIYRTHVAGPYFINFADAAPRIVPDPAVMLTFGKRLNDEQLQNFAAFFAQTSGLGENVVGDRWGSILRQIRKLLAIEELRSISPAEPLLRDVWLDDIQVMAARQTEGSAEGFYLAAKAGHNGENHNHNDVGNFIVYESGRPVLIDVGPGTYTRTTFSSDRYSVWNFQSDYHNVPTVNGVMQHHGRRFAASDVAYQSDESRAELRMQLAETYPDSAHVDSWIRTIVFQRDSGTISIEDSYELRSHREATTLNLMTSLNVTSEEPGVVRLTEAGFDDIEVIFDAARARVTVEEILIEDENLRARWGNALSRIVLADRSTDLTNRLTTTIRRSLGLRGRAE